MKLSHIVIFAWLFGLMATNASAQLPAPTKPAIYVADFEVTDMEGIKPYSAQVESTFTPMAAVSSCAVVAWSLKRDQPPNAS